MTALIAADRNRLRARAQTLAWLTIGWNVVEGVVAVTAGLAAGSVALVGFGLDSGVEVFAGAVVLWHFRGVSDEREQRAMRLIGVSFFALAAYVIAESARDLFVGNQADDSVVGIMLAAISLAIMPALAFAKRRTGRRLGNSVVVADSTETLLCSYLSLILLVGLLLNSIGWFWADPVAALGIAVIALREGREAWRGETCCE